MKAAQISEYGNVSVINISEIDKPNITDDQVLVEVYASSLNPFDTMVREGFLKEMIPLQLPVTLCGDIAGVVAEVGAKVTNVSVGDKVFGQANVVAGNSGALAEFAATVSGQLSQMPEKLDYQQAASLVLVGVSAWQALVEHIKLQSGQKIFIHGGAGGIGTVAIQIAKSIGAYVATTATGDGIDYVKSLGADKVIDYKSEKFAEKLQDFDAVFDNVGGDDFDASLNILKPGGIAVSMIAQPNEEKANELKVEALSQSTKVTTHALDELRSLIEKKTVTPHIDTVFPLEKIQEAFSTRETGTVRGKIVVAIR